MLDGPPPEQGQEGKESRERSGDREEAEQTPSPGGRKGTGV